MRPGQQRLQCGQELPAFGCHLVTALAMLDETGRPQFREPRIEQAGIGVARFLERAKRQRLAAKFPQYPQCGTPPEQVQDDHDWPSGGRAAYGLSWPWNFHALLFKASNPGCQPASAEQARRQSSATHDVKSAGRVRATRPERC
jgi:hypothetical protein